MKKSFFVPLLVIILFLYNSLCFSFPYHKKHNPQKVIKVFRGKIKRGENIYLILRKRGVKPGVIKFIEKKMRRVLNFKNDIKPKGEYELIIKCGKPVYFCYDRGPFEHYELCLLGGRYIVKTHEGKEEIFICKREGQIDSTLFDAFEKIGESQSLASMFAKIFAWKIDFHLDPWPGDRFSCIFEKVYKDGKFFRYGRILAAAYYGKCGTYRAFWYKTKGIQGYFSKKGLSLKSAFLKSPLKFTRISSRYTLRRPHPILGGIRPHLGVDYAAPYGTPVWSVADGKVIFVGWNDGFGKQVAIRHIANYTTYYNHLSRFAKGIRRGVFVRQGQIIGYVGSTGLATGPHLDFRVKKGKKFINPLSANYPSGSPIPKKYRKDFQKMVSIYLLLFEKKFNKKLICVEKGRKIRDALVDILKELNSKSRPKTARFDPYNKVAGKSIYTTF